MVEKAVASPLSERELELLKLVTTGATNQQIARELHISVNTVKVHLRNIFEKMGVESRTEATLVAIREGWVLVEGAQPAPAEIVAPAPLPPAIPRISLAQRIFLVVAALCVFALAFAPPVGSRLVQEQPRSPFTERPAAPPLIVSDARTARWNNLPAMPTARGRLAIVQHGGKLYAIGGDTDAGVTGATELYDIGAARWSTLVEKPTPAGNVSAAFAAGRIWVPGGFLSDGQITTLVETYDPAANEWARGVDLPEPLCAYALVTFEDNLYLFGGANAQGYLSVAYRFDTSAGEWQALPPLSSPRAFAGAAVLSGRIYVVGGYNGERELTTCQVYDRSSFRTATSRSHTRILARRRPPTSWAVCARRRWPRRLTRPPASWKAWPTAWPVAPRAWRRRSPAQPTRRWGRPATTPATRLATAPAIRPACTTPAIRLACTRTAIRPAIRRATAIRPATAPAIAPV